MAITRTQWNFTLMTEISAKTFGRKQWKIMHFSGVLQQFILKEKNIDYSAGDHPLDIVDEPKNRCKTLFVKTLSNVSRSKDMFVTFILVWEMLVKA